MQEYNPPPKNTKVIAKTIPTLPFENSKLVCTVQLKPGAPGVIQSWRTLGPFKGLCTCVPSLSLTQTLWFGTPTMSDTLFFLQQGVRFDPDLPQTIRLEFAKSNTKVSKPKQMIAPQAVTQPPLVHPLTGRK